MARQIVAAARSVNSMSKEGEAIRMIADRGLPMVVVDQPFIPKVPFVGIDDPRAARACAQHLKDLGHQNFAIVFSRLGSNGHHGRIERKTGVAGAEELLEFWSSRL